MIVDGAVQSAPGVRRLFPPSHPHDAPGLAGQTSRIALKVRVLRCSQWRQLLEQGLEA